MTALILCPTCWPRMFPEGSQPLYYWVQGEAGGTCSLCNPAPRPTEATADVDISRKYQCVECGYRHTDGVTVTVDFDIDDDQKEIRKPGTYTGWFTCDECGTEQHMTTRVTKKDLGQ